MGPRPMGGLWGRIRLKGGEKLARCSVEPGLTWQQEDEQAQGDMGEEACSSPSHTAAKWGQACCSSPPPAVVACLVFTLEYAPPALGLLLPSTYRYISSADHDDGRGKASAGGLPPQWH